MQLSRPVHILLYSYTYTFENHVVEFNRNLNSLTTALGTLSKFTNIFLFQNEKKKKRKKKRKKKSFLSPDDLGKDFTFFLFLEFTCATASLNPLTIFLGQSLVIKLIVILGTTLLNIFLFKKFFVKSTIELHFLLISFILAKFLEN